MAKKSTRKRWTAKDTERAMQAALANMNPEALARLAAEQEQLERDGFIPAGPNANNTLHRKKKLPKRS